MKIENLRFLVVEDHGFQRWMAANLLEGLGAKYVFTASDGREALLILEDREPPIDVIVTDLDMPGMDGMEFIRHVAEGKCTAALIVASAMEPALVASVEAMARAYGARLLGAIPKPLTAKKLKEAITGHLVAPEADANLEPRSFSVQQLAAGLERGEFEPFFQAKIVSNTQATSGAEAVARWRSPEQGIVRPQDFIGAMEESGLIDALTQMVVREAARNCRRWRDAEWDLTVSVNLSLKSLHDVSLSDRLVKIVNGQGLEPKHMIFEVTESVATSDLGRALENLSRLRMRGFGLSIDDYGTGYSSMERLTRVPFTELKIDQSFVKNAATQPSSRAMVESSLEMAQKLGIVAVAEGVETRSEWELVQALGCPLAQGYFFARPMDASEFMSWLRTPKRASVS
jgi:EAL domain-containing protein (putative c-di-GMP-specific phosphodiesterase class I)/CheY-like chemotaxis protein